MIFEHLNTIDSTQNYLKHKINIQEISEPYFVLASIQTSGYGRLGRVWQSKPNQNLTFSFALKEDWVNNPSQITFFIAFIIHQFIKKNYNITSFVKWPNDIYASNKKLGGILVEKYKKYYIIGVGLNINEINFHKDILAISLSEILNKRLDIKQVFRFFTQYLNQFLDDYQLKIPTFVLEFINQNLLWKGDIIHIILSDKTTIKGTLMGVDLTNGFVIIQDDKNKVYKYSNGSLQKY